MHLANAVHSGELSWRRFMLLVRGLPAESGWQRWLQDRSNRSLVDVGMEGRI